LAIALNKFSIVHKSRHAIRPFESFTNFVIYKFGNCPAVEGGMFTFIKCQMS